MNPQLPYNFQDDRPLFYPEIDRFGGYMTLQRPRNITQCCYLFDYIPMYRKDIQLTRRDRACRNLLYRFKEGHPVYVKIAARLVAQCIENNPFIMENVRDPLLLVVPASTAELHERRYKTFCEELSRRLGIENGYDRVNIMFDKNQNKGKSLAGRTYNHYVDEVDVEGRDIFLFDDLLTSGRTYTAMVDGLMGDGYGCGQVFGFFLGKTIEKPE